MRRQPNGTSKVANRFVQEMRRQAFDFKPLLLRREQSMFQIPERQPSDRICLDGGPVKPSFKPVDPGRNTTPASFREGQRLISTKSCGTVKFGKDRLSLLEELVAAGR